MSAEQSYLAVICMFVFVVGFVWYRIKTEPREAWEVCEGIDPNQPSSCHPNLTHGETNRLRHLQIDAMLLRNQHQAEYGQMQREIRKLKEKMNDTPR